MPQVAQKDNVMARRISHPARPRRRSIFNASSAIKSFAREMIAGWKEDNTPRMGAALAYYSVFAIAPLFLLTLSVAGLWFGRDEARNDLFGQLRTLIGADGAKALQSIIVAAAERPHHGVWAAILASSTLIVAATGVFAELQNALNTIWKVKRKTHGSVSGLLKLLRVRLISFAMLLGVGFLMLTSLLVNAGLSAMSSYMGGFFGSQHLLLGITNFVVSLAVISLLFAMILKMLPDVEIAWRDVWIGAVITALLFNLGKFLLGFYLGRSSVASAYGTAGSLVIILLWVYYSAQILFFGAQFTRIFTIHYGSHSAHARPRLKTR